MRILWVGKTPYDGEAGDEIFDRKTIAALRARGHVVDILHPARVGRLRLLLNLLRGVPYYRALFARAENQAALDACAGGHDAVIVSWEPFDILRPPPDMPALLVLHNVTSRALPALYPGHPAVAALAWRAAWWERASYRPGRWSAIATLSARDRDFVAALPDAPEVVLAQPGMPPLAPLEEDAAFRPEIVVSGTFGWRPKRRDLLRFAAEYARVADRLPVRGADWPARAAELLPPGPPPDPRELAAAIRIGLITDRFEAGHKLKTLAYLAGNQIVLSLADVAFDFEQVPDHDFFIRRIRTVEEIGLHAREIAAIDPDILRGRLARFKARCAARFSWEGVAGSLVAALERSLSLARQAQAAE